MSVNRSDPGHGHGHALILALLVVLAPPKPAPAECVTNRPFPGVACYSVTRPDPPTRMFIAEVDLTDPNVHLRVAPGGPDPDGHGPWQTTLMTPTRIGAREGFDLVVNGDFFDARGVKDAEGTNSSYRPEIWAAVNGPATTDGKVWSNSTNPWPCLIVHRDRKVTIESRSRPEPNDWEVVAGNTLLLDRGAVVPHQSKTRHPRTAVGLNSGGTRLILLVADGRKPGIAVGLSYAEEAAELLRWGCCQALNLDGGGSSVMALRDPASGQFQILNQPTDGHERAVASALGISVQAVAPYSPSQVITKLKWDESLVKLKSRAGDNWPITWADGDLQTTAWGDGPGFDELPPRLSLGLAHVWGDPPNLRAEDFASDADTLEGGGSKAIKASGLLLVDDILYMWVRNYRPPGSEEFTHARLAWSKNRGTNWTWVEWYFTETFGCPEFVQYGPNYAGARDDYVYVVSQANDSAYGYSPDIVMARVPKRQVPVRDRYEFFAGLDGGGQPRWSRDLNARKPIFTDSNGTQRVAITFNRGLKRYLLTTSHRPPGSQAMHTPALGVFEAPEPWGPWCTVFYDSHWSGTNRTYHHKFPTKWMSPDGRTLWLLYSGLDGGLYTFCLKKAMLELAR